MSRRLSRRRALVGALATVGVVAGLLGYAVADAVDVVPGVLTVEPEPTPPPPFPAAPGATEPAGAAPTVLPPVGTQAPAPDPASLAALLTPLLGDPALGPSVGASVVDALTGQRLLDVDAATPREPASVTKLLTGAAALVRLGQDTTVPTRAVTGVAADEVVLVAGGDVLLGAGPGTPDAVRGRAGLADLAAQAAVELRAAGRTTVAVRVDDSLFTGERMGPGWTQSDLDLGFVAPVTALAVDAGRTRDERYAPRVPDPSLAATAVFADLLRGQGISVVGDVTRTAAPPQPDVLGEVRSAPVGEVVEYMLQASDNNVAEALARLVAAEVGRPTTFADSAQAVLDEVALLGVDVAGAHLADGSGLSDGSVLPASLLTDLLATAASADHPELRPLLTGLPVAGLDGTLLERFGGDGAGAGVGTVRAKTGSLRGVTSLAGVVTTADGRLLAFAVLADAVPATEPSRAAVDDVASALAACGCG